jgi:hypothetical protein
MNQKATTKDELFLLELHRKALAQGDPFMEVDRYAIGKSIGQNDKGINTIARDLAQANFIKKGEEGAVFLTALGLRLVQQLIKERDRAR